MKFNPTCPFRMFALTVPSIWVASAAWLCGQEVASVVDSRVEADPQVEVATPQEVERRGGLELAVAVSAAYDSNIYLSSTDPTSDLVCRIGPLMAYTQGDPDEGEGGYIRVAYQPTGVIYADQTTNNRIDQSAVVAAGWRGKVSKITYQGTAQSLGDATADTGTQTERLELENQIRAAWMVREKITLEAAVGGRQTRYQNSTLVDSGRIYGETAVSYAYSPKTVVGAAYQAGRLKIEDADSQSIQQVTGSFDWQPREKIQIKLDGGAEFRRAGGTTSVNPVLNARIDWEPREGTGVFLTAYQRQEVSALNEGQIYEVKGMAAGLSQRLGGNWTASLEGGYEVASYVSDASTGAPSRRDEIWFVRPALRYRFSDELDASVFFQASEDQSTDQNFGYDAVMTGVELNYKF
jgi:hypothetical protein